MFDIIWVFSRFNSGCKDWCFFVFKDSGDGETDSGAKIGGGLVTVVTFSGTGGGGSVGGGGL